MTVNGKSSSNEIANFSNFRGINLCTNSIFYTTPAIQVRLPQIQSDTPMSDTQGGTNEEKKKV